MRKYQKAGKSPGTEENAQIKRRYSGMMVTIRAGLHQHEDVDTSATRIKTRIDSTFTRTTAFYCGECQTFNNGMVNSNSHNRGDILTPLNTRPPLLRVSVQEAILKAGVRFHIFKSRAHAVCSPTNLSPAPPRQRTDNFHLRISLPLQPLFQDTYVLTGGVAKLLQKRRTGSATTEEDRVQGERKILVVHR